MWRTCVFLIPILALAQAPQPDGAGVRVGRLPVKWNASGPNCADVPKWQIHEYNEDFFILRESGCTNYEKPFLYLLFGKERALLEDTGAGQTDVARVVNEIVDKRHLPLLVMHSHSHGDHVSGDRQFPNALPLTIEATKEAFHIKNWPEDVGQIDLGNRIIDVIPIPGHDKLSIAMYDRQTGVLLTGDSLYPGRLYISDFPEFMRSTQRLVDVTRGKIVTHVLGTHIEQAATPYLDYPVRTVYQPDEHTLALSRGTLLELNEALIQMRDKPVRMAMRDFTIWPRQ